MFRIGKDQKNDQPNHAPTIDNPVAATAPQPHTFAHTRASDNANSNGTSGSSSRAMTESESLARDIKEGTLSSFVGNGTKLTGDITFKGMLRVDGFLTGHITSGDGTLLIGTNGQVDANMEVAVATIHGIVNGDVIATQRIEIGRTAKVAGNIQTPSLVVEQGGILEGSCRMIELKDAVDKHHAEEKERRAYPTAITLEKEDDLADDLEVAS